MVINILTTLLIQFNNSLGEALNRETRLTISSSSLNPNNLDVCINAPMFSQGQRESPLLITDISWGKDDKKKILKVITHYTDLKEIVIKINGVEDDSCPSGFLYLYNNKSFGYHPLSSVHN